MWRTWDRIRFWSCGSSLVKKGKFLDLRRCGNHGLFYSGSMGAKTAAMDKQVIAVCGDGSFQMSMMELATIRQHNIPVKIIVLKPAGKAHHHDPKSELYESTATYLENAGYIVKSFNLVNPENSDSWNCLGEIGGQETMAQVFADVIIQNTGSAKGDHFWDNAEMNLLKALILYVDQGSHRRQRISDRYTNS